ISQVNPRAGVYKKLVIRNGRLAGAVLVGAQDHGNRLRRMFTSEEPLPGPALDLLLDGTARDALLEEGAGADLTALADDTHICNCHTVSKARIVAAIRQGKRCLQAPAAPGVRQDQRPAIAHHRRPIRSIRQGLLRFDRTAANPTALVHARRYA